MKRIFLLLTIASALSAQTIINGSRIFKGTMDASGATRTLPNRTGSGSPSGRENCAQPGETYFQVDATAGQNLWACLTPGAPGIWNQQNTSGIPGPAGPPGATGPQGPAGTGGGAGTTSVGNASTVNYVVASGHNGIENFKFTAPLSQSVASSTLDCTNCTIGQIITFDVMQNSTGGYTIVPPAGTIGAGVIDPTPNARSLQIFKWDGANLIALTGIVSGTGGVLAFGATASACTMMIPASYLCAWFDSTDNTVKAKDSSGNVYMMPLSKPSRTANQFVTNISTTGIQQTAAIAAADLPAALSNSTSINGTTIPSAATLTQTIGSGTMTVNPGAIPSGACSNAITTTITGTVTADNIMADFSADPSSTTGYSPTTNGMLTIIKWPTTNTVNIKVCNNTSASVTPGSIGLNVRVVR
jgi:hypothetical protein